MVSPWHRDHVRPWPISVAKLVDLIDLGWSDYRIASYFSVEPKKISALASTMDWFSRRRILWVWRMRRRKRLATINVGVRRHCAHFRCDTSAPVRWCRERSRGVANATSNFNVVSQNPSTSLRMVLSHSVREIHHVHSQRVIQIIGSNLSCRCRRIWSCRSCRWACTKSRFCET